MTAGQRIHARQVDHRHDAVCLRSMVPLVLAAADAVDIPEHAQRRRCVSALPTMCARNMLVARVRCSTSRRRSVQQVGAAVHRAQVEEHAGQHQRHRFGRRPPTAEVLGPTRARLTPLVRHRHHLAGQWM
jgi:hypothetical protein